MRRTYVSNTLGLLVIQGANFIVPLLLIPIIVSAQGIEAYGTYATVLAFYQMGAMVCDYGFDYSSVRTLKQLEGEAAAGRRIIWDTFGARFLLFALVGPTCAVTLWLFPGIADASLLLAGLLVPATSALSVHWLYLAQGRLIQLVVPVGLARVASLAAVAVVYPHFPSIAIVMLFTLGAPFLVHARFWMKERRQLIARGVERLSIAGSVRAIRLGGTAFYITFLSSLIASSALPILSIFGTPRDTGLFAAVEKVAKAGFGVAKPFLVALYPEMSALFRKAASHWQAIIVRVSTLAILLGVTSVFLISAFWTEASVLLFGGVAPGSEWIAYGFAVWLTIGVVNNAIGIQGLLASGNERAYATALSVAAIVLAVGYGLASMNRGPLAILLAMVAAESTLLILNTRALRRVLRRNVP